MWVAAAEQDVAMTSSRHKRHDCLGIDIYVVKQEKPIALIGGKPMENRVD
jgi:hypothetical protein